MLKLQLIAHQALAKINFRNLRFFNSLNPERRIPNPEPFVTFLFWSLLFLALNAPAVEIIAHRGASGDAPENTLSAMKLAWEQGADAIELDLWLSKDGKLVVFHDADTKRFADTPRKVAEMTWHELQRLDVGAWKGEKFKGERIPALEPILDTIPQGKRAVLEIKCGPEILPQLKRVIAASGKGPKELAIISFRHDTLTASKKVFPDIEHYFLHGYKKDTATGELPKLPDMLRLAKEANAQGLDLHFDWPMTKAFVNEVKAAGLKLIAWTVNDPKVAKRLIDAGVDGITTDRPQLLREAVLPEGVSNTQNPADKPLPPGEALKKITVPKGFQVSLFAAEPHVLQPVAFDFDDRGRLWVVECFSYPDFKTENKDRVLIFTDTDNDGQFDERKVFMDNGRRLSGIAWGFGGVWLCSAPEILFIPDRNGDDVPDDKPVVHLDGWTLKASHNMVNGLAWGPDGWLYGRQGILSDSLVGKPGAAEKDRTLLNCAIWRYHPTRHIFEVVARGTTNPWGLDWDENGQAFFSNNVIGHLWHLIPGAHYQRMYGEDFNPYLFELMPACSDHLHWAGSDWTKTRGGQGEHDTLGGGHSHCGAMIYLGDNWPAEYRGTLMMANTHGNRLLYDTPERAGCGYVAKHGKSFFMANDPWFRGVSIHSGPDGSVFASDWNDFGECHDYDGTYRSSGRIYKITYGAPKRGEPFNLAKLSDKELVELQLSKNEWHVRHARRLLQERAVAGTLGRDTAKLIDPRRNLRGLWAMNAIGALDATTLTQLVTHDNEHMRWWAVKFLSERDDFTDAHRELFINRAREDQSGLVRLGLASALQRMPLDRRWELAEALSMRSEDGKDPNQPLMIWYGIEPAVPKNTDRAIQLMTASKIPLVRQFIARRLAGLEPSPAGKTDRQAQAAPLR